jgi:ubiquinone/menaquinone biosynthesis C-methylase UbiE
MTQQFNIDTDATMSRARINASKAKHDLEEWMIRLLPPLRGFQVLDLGCGTGKQVFRLAPLVSEGGLLLGVDLSQDAVRAVNQRAKTEKVRSVEAQQMSLDDCLHRLAGKHFDLIISSYAIYYAQDPVALLKGLRSILTDQGVVFVCGYGNGTNREFYDIVNSFINNSSAQLKPIDDFLGLTQIREIADMYSHFTISRLKNQILFDSADGVLSWWKHHKSFVSSVADRVEDIIRTHFETNNIFSLSKNVLGVRFDA